MQTKMNWVTNGKAFFLTFTAGRKVTGEAMVGELNGEWVSGAKLLGTAPFAKGYYELKAAAPKFASRELAEANAYQLAQLCVDEEFAMRQYLFDLDKKSPWKNTPAPVKSSISFSAA